MSHKKDVPLAACVLIGETIAAMRISDSSKQAYQGHMMQFARFVGDKYGSADMQRITRVEVQSFMDALQAEHYSARSISAKLSALYAFCKATRQYEAIEDIERPKIMKTSIPRSLDKLTRNKLLRDVERAGNKRDQAMIYMMLFAGLRVSEVAALDLGDIEVRERSGWVTVRHGKGNKERRVPLPADARWALSEYLGERDPDESGALFLSNRGKRITSRTIQHMCSKYGINPHSLRHTYCRVLVSSGVDITAVAALAGHSDIQTTAVYTQPNDTELEEAIKRAF